MAISMQPRFPMPDRTKQPVRFAKDKCFAVYQIDTHDGAVYIKESWKWPVHTSLVFLRPIGCCLSIRIASCRSRSCGLRPSCNATTRAQVGFACRPTETLRRREKAPALTERV